MQQVLSQKRQEIFTVWFADLRENAEIVDYRHFFYLRLLRGSDNVIRLALSQINVTVGDLAGNRDKILDHVSQGTRFGGAYCRFSRARDPGLSARRFAF